MVYFSTTYRHLGPYSHSLFNLIGIYAIIALLKTKAGMMHTVVIGIVAILLYLVASIMLAIRLRNRDTSSAGKWRGLALAFVAVMLHAWLLAQQLFLEEGLNMGVFNAISLLTWLISSLLIISALARPTENLGIIAFPGTGLAVALEAVTSTEHITSVANTPLEIHILVSIAAYSLLSIAAVQAVLLTIQDRHLRNKRPGGFIRALPPLQTMETLLFQIIALGFALQSLSLVTGFIFLENMMAQHLAHKTVLSITAWVVFAILLWGRWKFGWRGRTAIRWTLGGFIILALSYIGSKMVLEVILQ